MVMHLNIEKILKKNLKTKVLLKNKVKIILALVTISAIVVPQYVLPKFVIQFVKTLLGKVVCVLAILYVACKDMTSAVFLTLLFGFILYTSNKYVLENMSLGDHAQWHKSQPTEAAAPPPVVGAAQPTAQPPAQPPSPTQREVPPPAQDKDNEQFVGAGEFESFMARV